MYIVHFSMLTNMHKHISSNFEMFIYMQVIFYLCAQLGIQMKYIRKCEVIYRAIDLNIGIYLIWKIWLGGS